LALGRDLWEHYHTIVVLPIDRPLVADLFERRKEMPWGDLSEAVGHAHDRPSRWVLPGLFPI
jgi:hypothetical protein